MREKDAILAWDFNSSSPRQTRHIVLGSIRESSYIVSKVFCRSRISCFVWTSFKANVVSSIWAVAALLALDAGYL